MYKTWNCALLGITTNILYPLNISTIQPLNNKNTNKKYKMKLKLLKLGSAEHDTAKLV